MPSIFFGSKRGNDLRTKKLYSLASFIVRETNSAMAALLACSSVKDYCKEKKRMKCSTKP